MSVIGKTIAGRREFGVALGGSQGTAHGLHCSDHIDEVFDRLFMLLEPHRMRQSEAEAQCKLCLRQPVVEVVPTQPARDRFRRRVDKKHALPRHEHVVKPHLAVELVIAAAERRDERIALAARGLTAQCRDARRIYWDYEARAVFSDLDAAQRTYIDVFGKGGARVHADLAANDDTGIALPHELERDAVAGVRTHALADDRGAAAVSEKPPSACNQLAIGDRLGHLLFGSI